MPNEIKKITEKELITKGVVALADKPNSVSQVSHKYGQAALSPEKLKAWFDALPRLLAGKINEIIDYMVSHDQNDALDQLIRASMNGTLFDDLHVNDPRGRLVKMKDTVATSTYPFIFFFNNFETALSVIGAGEARPGDSFVFLAADAIFQPLKTTDEAYCFYIELEALGVEPQDVHLYETGIGDSHIKTLTMDDVAARLPVLEFACSYYYEPLKAIFFVCAAGEDYSLEGKSDGDVYEYNVKHYWDGRKVVFNIDD